MMSSLIGALTTVLAIAAVIGGGHGVKLQERFAWQELEFAWPSETVKQEATASGRYKASHNLPLGMDVWNDKLFITVPRWKSGVASSLSYVSLKEAGTTRSPILHPYPSWEANTIASKNPAPVVEATDESTATDAAEETIAAGRANAPKAARSDVALANNASIVSTFRIRVDECDRLWVMDTGLADILGNPEQIAAPALVIFDLKTDKLIRRFEFAAEDAKEDTFFANVIVDVDPDECHKAFAYVPDLGAYGVVVYSFEENKSWRVKHNFFHFDPLNGDYNVGGVNFQWTDGVFGMAVGEPQPDGSRPVYFHALSSNKEFVVSNLVLQNKTYSTSSDAYFDFKLLGDRGQNGQSSAEFYDDESDVLFYTQVNKDGVGCWNSRKPYAPETQGIVDTDSDALVFPNDLKIDLDRNLWVLSDRMPVFLYKTLDAKQYNYRILSAKIDDAVRGTPCAA